MDVHSALTRLVRTARVLDGVGVEPTAEGVLLCGHRHGPVVPWSEIAEVLGPDEPTAAAARLRLEVLVELRRTVDDLGPAAVEAVGRALRPLALPVGHALHPGPRWVHHAVPGGVLDVGLGVTRLLPGQDGVLPLPPFVAAAAGVHPAAVWHRLPPLAERLSTFAIDRMEADGAGPAGPAVLAGVGGCDALTLLTLESVRARLGAPLGLVSAPRRDRVWVGAAAADREYVRAVWMLTALGRRGVPDPMALSAAGISGTALQSSRPSGPR